MILKNVNIIVEEKPTGEISAGAGVFPLGKLLVPVLENNFGEGIKIQP